MVGHYNGQPLIVLEEFNHQSLRLLYNTWKDFVRGVSPILVKVYGSERYIVSAMMLIVSNREPWLVYPQDHDQGMGSRREDGSLVISYAERRWFTLRKTIWSD